MIKGYFYRSAGSAAGNKRGSAMVMLAIIFVGFALCIAASVNVSRRLVVSSECEAFGRVWTKAVLSEYDVHLLEDYSIMAYFGNDSEISGRVSSYLRYSSENRLDAHIKGVNADLTGFELGDPANFRKALKLGFPVAAADEIISGRGRTFRNLDNGNGYEGEGRVISNQIVLDTLPSGGSGGCVSSDALAEKAASAGNDSGVRQMIASAGTDMLMLVRCFDNHVSKSDDKDHLFINEWEYVIKGSPDDEVNYRACRRRLFAARNALNLVALYRDPAKVEAVAALAAAISPGPLAAVTQVIIAEIWALIETESDMDDLYSDGRVPLIKTPDQWKTDLGAVLESKEFRGKLDDESKKQLAENREGLRGITGSVTTVDRFREGLNYDEYLMLMIMCMNENTRLLRIMDLVQINMKYRYYRDFNMMEYYTGTRFTIEANGKSHEFEDEYK